MSTPEIPTEEKLENQFILRLPARPAAKLRKYLRTKPKKVKRNMQIVLDPEAREGEVTLKNRTFQMKLVDLPTIVESLKTINSKVFFKTADVSQILMPIDKKQKHGNVAAAKKKEDKKFQWPHGLTPPMKNARHCRFRKILLNPHRMDSTDISKELKWLLQSDTEAVEVRWELVDDPSYKAKSETVCNTNFLNEELLFGEIISDSEDDDSAVISIHTSQEKTEDSPIEIKTEDSPIEIIDIEST